MFSVETHNSDETKAIAALFSKVVESGTVVLLEGDLGSGKTTFTQGLGQSLGIKRAIKSPTYNIVKEYPVDSKTNLIHIDAYRLEEGGADSIDLYRYINDENIILIEWSQFLKEYLPRDYMIIRFETSESLNHRVIKFAVSNDVTTRYVTQLQRFIQLVGEKHA